MADAADELALRRFRADDLVVETKPDLTPVTEADRAVEQMLRDRLARERPGDAFTGEEFGSDGDATRRWIVDPIDGTKSYARHPGVGDPHRARGGSRAHAGRGVRACARQPVVGEAWVMVRFATVNECRSRA